MRNRPSTPEGCLIRDRRQLLSPEPTTSEMAAKFGWSVEKFGMIERGRTRARAGRPPGEHHPTAADLARIAAELRITPEELEGVGRSDAAEVLRSPGAASPEPDRDILALVDKLFDALAEGRPDRDVLEYFWYRRTDLEGRRKPLHERVENVTGYIDDGARRLQAESGRSARTRSEERAAG